MLSHFRREVGSDCHVPRVRGNDVRHRKSSELPRLLRLQLRGYDASRRGRRNGARSEVGRFVLGSSGTSAVWLLYAPGGVPLRRRCPRHPLLALRLRNRRLATLFRRYLHPGVARDAGARVFHGLLGPRRTRGRRRPARPRLLEPRVRFALLERFRSAFAFRRRDVDPRSSRLRDAFVETLPRRCRSDFLSRCDERRRDARGDSAPAVDFAVRRVPRLRRVQFDRRVLRERFVGEVSLQDNGVIVSRRKRVSRLRTTHDFAPLTSGQHI